MCLEQFDYYLMEKDGKEAIWFGNKARDKFVIKPFFLDFKYRNDKDKKWDQDLYYTIGIGEKSFSSWLTTYSNNLEKIRHSIEHYIFSDETKIELDFDFIPTEIILKHKSVVSEVIKGEYGTGYRWKDFMLVVVKPNEFVENDVPIFGVCRKRQVIQEIYEAFLRVGWRGYEYDKEGQFTWDFPAMEFYNKIKSPLIENFICDRKEDYTKACVRQERVDHILTLSPDVDETIADEEAITCGYPNDDDTMEIGFDIDNTEYKLHVPGIYQWQKDFERNADFVESKMKEDFDIEAWHKQGLELAAKIREQLPPNIDLWYKAPFEDSKNRDKRPLLIYNK